MRYAAGSDISELVDINFTTTLLHHFCINHDRQDELNYADELEANVGNVYFWKEEKRTRKLTRIMFFSFSTKSVLA